ncbi:ribonuclease H-like domain-containing protein [Tanacetum coccineum]
MVEKLYAVHNINSLIPEKLDLAESNYSTSTVSFLRSWISLNQTTPHGVNLALSRHWPVHQLDVKNAFLHGSLSETVYMQHPPGRGSDTYYLLLYVDDIILTASSTAFLQSIIATLHAEFSMTDLGLLNYFLGIYVTRNTSGMFLSQQKYASKLLERASILTCNPCCTPVDTDSKLSADGDLVSDPTLYRSLAGALQYLTFTRPDISYVVQQVCLYMHDPRDPHFSALKRILLFDLWKSKSLSSGYRSPNER